MYSKEKFAEIVLKKYPDAVIYTDENDCSLAGRKDEKSIHLLGCVLCFDNKIEVINDNLFIQGQEAVPATSVIEDDSLNPAMMSLFFCPVCSRMIVDPRISSLPVMGRAINDWKD